MNRHTFATLAKPRKPLVVISICITLGVLTMAAASEQVPFKGGLEGSFTVTPLTPTSFAVLMTGTGNGTQLGHFNITIPHVVNSTTGTAHGTLTITAADGDTLTAEFDGESQPTDSPAVFAVKETATITGGAGRFANARGGFRDGSTCQPCDGPDDRLV